MRLARLEDSGRSKPLAVVCRLGSEVDMKLDVEKGNSPDFVRMLANLYLVDRNLLGIVLLDSLDCMTTKANLVAAEVGDGTKTHCHGGGQGRLGNAENGCRLNGDHTGADSC